MLKIESDFNNLKQEMGKFFDVNYEHVKHSD